MIDTIEVVIGFPRHRKTRRLERILGNDARWLPVYLWLYTLENARDSGDLSHLTPDDLAAVLDYHGDATALRAALVTAEFLDAAGMVVGWSERYTQRFAFYERRARTAADRRWGKRDEAKQPDASSTAQASPSIQATATPPPPAPPDIIQRPDLTGPDLTLSSIAKHSSSMLVASQKQEIAALALPFASPEFADAWANWGKHRTEIRKPLKPTATKAQLAKLAAMGEARAIAAINHSLANQWTGIFEPDANRSNPTNGQHRNSTGFRHTAIASSDYRGISD
jgi:hypothetical protein